MYIHLELFKETCTVLKISPRSKDLLYINLYVGSIFDTEIYLQILFHEDKNYFDAEYLI